MRNRSQKTEDRRQKKQGREYIKLKEKVCVLFFMLCFLFFAEIAYSQSLVIMAKKTPGEIPVDPNNIIWKNASSINIHLATQVMTKPRIYESAVRDLKVRALHNTKEIAFLVEWTDKTEDTYVDIGKFSDAVALEFPSSSATAKPHFAMGDKENTVNIWYWKAEWQKPSDITANIQRTYATVDDFAGGIMVDNPVSKKRLSPVENIIAQGFGSATDMEKADNQNISGNGKWKSNRWAVVFKRTLIDKDKFGVNFKEGGITPVAFALWNGSEGHRGGRKVVSTWYYVGLETEEKAITYVYPLIAFIGTLLLEGGIILLIRRKV